MSARAGLRRTAQARSISPQQPGLRTSAVQRAQTTLPWLERLRRCGCVSAESRALSVNPKAPSAATQSDVCAIFIKPADVEGAQYSVLDNVALTTRLDEVKKLWARSQLLPASPSLIVLRRVSTGASMPSADDEAAAFQSSDAILNDPSLTVLEAQLSPTSWLLARTCTRLPAAGTSAHACGPDAHHVCRAHGTRQADMSPQLRVPKPPSLHFGALCRVQRFRRTAAHCVCRRARSFWAVRSLAPRSTCATIIKGCWRFC